MTYKELRCLVNGVIVDVASDRYRGDLYYDDGGKLILAGIPSGGVVLKCEQSDLKVASVSVLPALGGYKTMLLGTVLESGERLTSLVQGMTGTIKTLFPKTAYQVRFSNCCGALVKPCGDALSSSDIVCSECLGRLNSVDTHWVTNRFTAFKVGEYVEHAVSGRLGYLTYRDAAEAIVDYGLSIGTETYDPEAISKAAVEPLDSLLSYCGHVIELIGANLSDFPHISNLKRYVVHSSSEKYLYIVDDVGTVVALDAESLLRLGAKDALTNTYLLRRVKNA